MEAVTAGVLELAWEPSVMRGVALAGGE